MFYLLFIYTMVVYGIANAFVYFNGPFNVIDKFRRWLGEKNPTFEELFSCMFCLPTNIGLILSLLFIIFGVGYAPFAYFYTTGALEWYMAVIFDAFYAGGMTYLIHTIQQRIEKAPEDTKELLMD